MQFGLQKHPKPSQNSKKQHQEEKEYFQRWCRKQGWQNCQPYLACKSGGLYFHAQQSQLGFSVSFMNHLSDLDSRFNMTNSCCTSIMVGLERQGAAKAVTAQKLLMWGLCTNSPCHTLQWWGNDSDPVGYLFCLLSSSPEEDTVPYSGAQLHSQIFLSSCHTLLSSYFNLSGQIMSETSVSSAACQLWI